MCEMFTRTKFVKLWEKSWYFPPIKLYKYYTKLIKMWEKSCEFVG